MFLIPRGKKQTDNFYYNYYNQSDLYMQALNQEQRDRISLTSTLIPNDAARILDIGCGDGRVTNYLAKKYDVTGLDICFSSLQHLKTKKILASVEKLPFREKSFDLVIATEVLEHIPASVYQHSLSEIQRIAQKYILISVPYKENLLEKMTKCTKCGTVFNFDRHLRSFSEQKIFKLFKNFNLLKCECFGPRVQYFNVFILFIKYYLGNDWNYSKISICPNCGFKCSSQNKKVLNPFSWFSNGLEWRINRIVPSIYKNKRWIVALYEKKS